MFYPGSCTVRRCFHGGRCTGSAAGCLCPRGFHGPQCQYGKHASMAICRTQTKTSIKLNLFLLVLQTWMSVRHKMVGVNTTVVILLADITAPVTLVMHYRMIRNVV